MRVGCIVTLCTLLGLATVSSAVGGYQPVKDLTTVQPVVDFVTNYVATRENDFSLGSPTIVSAQYQIVAGTNYILDLRFPILGSKTSTSYPPNFEIEVKIFKDLQGVYTINQIKRVSSTPKPPCIPGGKCDHVVDTNSRAAAHFAVVEMNRREGKSLTLIEIIKVQTQIVNGVNYHMEIKCSLPDGTTSMYNVIVYKSFKNEYSLSDYTLSSLPPAGVYLGPGPVIDGTGLGNNKQPVNRAGGWQNANMADAAVAKQVSEAAKFAFDQIAAQINTKLTFVGYRNVRYQVVAGTNYKFDLECIQMGNTKTGFNCQVFVGLGSNGMSLTNFKQFYIGK